jgi:hypothetical protein
MLWAGNEWRSPIRVVQQIRSILSDGVEHLGDIALKQQHADRDGRYAVAKLAMGTHADRPSSSGEGDFGPAKFDIDDVVSIGVDWADGFNFMPLDVPRHQSTIQNSSLINREDDRIGGSTSAETVYQNGDDDQPRQAKPYYGGNGYGEAGCRRRCGAKENKAGNSDLGEAPREGGPTDLANRLCSFDEIVLD